MLSTKNKTKKQTKKEEGGQHVRWTVRCTCYHKEVLQQNGMLN